MFPDLYNNKCFLIISIILLLGIGFSIISLCDNTHYDRNIITNYPINHKESYKSEIKNKPKLTLYFATWCGHCNTFKKTWNDIITDQNNLHFVDFDTIDCSGDKPETSIHKTPNGTNIDGFPTIILSINNKDIFYQGSRNKKSIDDFLQRRLF
jgi:hypothetical protein